MFKNCIPFVDDRSKVLAQKKAELGKRRSATSQNRIRFISSFGAEATVKKGKRNKEDTFEMDDED